tara:strand:- start:86 stop:220 length:135 start_codon:yes stop_codon:yes gene_type:complete
MGLFTRWRHSSSDTSVMQRLAFTFCMLATMGSWVAIFGLALALK